MWRSILVFSMFLAICYCDKNNQVYYKKKHHHHHDYFYHHLLLKGIFSYLTFWAIKIKIIFVLGTIFTIFMFAGKFFAILKYAEIGHHKHEPEKIYIQAHDHHDHGHSFDFVPPNGFSDSYSPNYYPGSFSGANSGVVVDHPPDGAELAHRHGYKRSNEEDGIYDKLMSFTRLIRTLNISNIAFNTLHINEEDCRKKFVCEQEIISNKSIILKKISELLTDDNYQQYKTNSTVTSETNCTSLYPNCKMETVT